MADGVIKLGQKITPHPCNSEMEARNWAAVKQAFDYLDQIINIEIINNVIVYDLTNITNIEVTNIEVTNVQVLNDIEVTNNLIVNNDVLIVNNLTVQNNVWILQVLNVTNIQVIDISVTNISVYNVTANYYMNSSGTYLCAPDCTSGSSGSGGGSPGGECADIPATLYLTLDGGALCSGLTGVVIELTYDSGAGAWVSATPTAFCTGGTIHVTVHCNGSLPSGTSLQERMSMGVEILCNGEASPRGGEVPCTSASAGPFTAEFGPLDIGAGAGSACSDCCSGRELGITATLSE